MGYTSIPTVLFSITITIMVVAAIILLIAALGSNKKERWALIVGIITIITLIATNTSLSTSYENTSTKNKTSILPVKEFSSVKFLGTSVAKMNMADNLLYLPNPSDGTLVPIKNIEHRKQCRDCVMVSGLKENDTAYVYMVEDKMLFSAHNDIYLNSLIRSIEKEKR